MSCFKGPSFIKDKLIYHSDIGYDKNFPVLADQTSYGYHGTIIGSISDLYGGVIDLSTINLKQIRKIQPPWTVSYWIKPYQSTPFTSGSNHYIWSLWNNSNLPGRFLIYLNSIGWSVNDIKTDKNGKVYVAGAWAQWNNTYDRKNLVRLDISGGYDNTFIPSDNSYKRSHQLTSIQYDPVEDVLWGSGTNGSYSRTKISSTGSVILTLGLSSGVNVGCLLDRTRKRVYYTGAFSTIDGISSKYITCVDLTGSRVAEFNVGVGLNKYYNIGLALDNNDGSIYVGGDLTSYSGSSSNRIVKIKVDGTIDTSFNIGSGFNNRVWSIAVQEDRKVLVAGDFTSYSGSTVTRLVRLKQDGTLDPDFSPPTFNNDVIRVKTDNQGRIYCTGYFTSPKNRIVRLDPSGAIDSSFNVGVGFNNNTGALHVSGSKVYVGGAFTSYSGSSCFRFVRINEDGTRDTSWDSDPGPSDSSYRIFGYYYAENSSGGSAALFFGPSKFSTDRHYFRDIGDGWWFREFKNYVFVMDSSGTLKIYENSNNTYTVNASAYPGRYLNMEKITGQASSYLGMYSIWNRELSQEEITQLYEIYRKRYRS